MLLETAWKDFSCLHMFIFFFFLLSFLSCLWMWLSTLQLAQPHYCSSQALFSVCLCLSLSSYTCPCTRAKRKASPLIMSIFWCPQIFVSAAARSTIFWPQKLPRAPTYGSPSRSLWLQLVILGTVENGFDGSEEDDWFLRATLVCTFSCPVERSPAFGL